MHSDRSDSAGTPDPDESPEETLSAMIAGFKSTQAIYVAAKLGLADLLVDGPKSTETLAAETGVQGFPLYRVLRALASKGIFRETADGTFALTPLAEPLRSDVEGSKRAMAIMMGEEHYRAWGELLHSVRTGETAFDHIYGKPFFDYLADHPEKAANFDAAMVDVHGRETDAILDAYDLSDVTTLADVGGGNGSVLRAALVRDPHMQGLLFDLPSVVARAQRDIERDGLANRCRLVGGDFFEAVPEGADAYLLRHIIHDWPDDKSVEILRTVRRAIPPHGRLLILESVLPPGNEPFFGKMLDLTMMVIPGGRERTAEEYRSLLDAAGFRLNRIVPSRSEISVVEGVPATAE